MVATLQCFADSHWHPAACPASSLAASAEWASTGWQSQTGGKDLHSTAWHWSLGLPSAEAPPHPSPVHLLHAVPALQPQDRPHAPQPAMLPLLSLKDNPRSDCDKRLRCLSSRGLAKPAALWRASSSKECGATRHHSSTEGESMFNMSLSL